MEQSTWFEVIFHAPTGPKVSTSTRSAPTWPRWRPTLPRWKPGSPPLGWNATPCGTQLADARDHEDGPSGLPDPAGPDPLRKLGAEVEQAPVETMPADPNRIPGGEPHPARKRRRPGCSPRNSRWAVPAATRS